MVSCVLHNTKVQKLQLTYSQPVNETSFSEEVEVATPTLYEEDKAVGTFSKIGYGEWELNYTPQRGKAYRLVVEVPGHPTITATTTMPIPVGIYHESHATEIALSHFYKWITLLPFGFVPYSLV